MQTREIFPSSSTATLASSTPSSRRFASVSTTRWDAWKTVSKSLRSGDTLTRSNDFPCFHRNEQIPKWINEPRIKLLRDNIEVSQTLLLNSSIRFNYFFPSLSLRKTYLENIFVWVFFFCHRREIFHSVCRHFIKGIAWKGQWVFICWLRQRVRALEWNAKRVSVVTTETRLIEMPIIWGRTAVHGLFNERKIRCERSWNFLIRLGFEARVWKRQRAVKQSLNGSCESCVGFRVYGLYFTISYVERWRATLDSTMSRNDPGQWKFTQQTKFSPSRNMKKIDKRFRANNHNSSRSDAAEIKARWRVAAKTLFVYFQSPLFSIRDVRKVFHDLKITRKSLPTLMDVELSESIAVKIISDRDELLIDFQVSR